MKTKAICILSCLLANTNLAQSEECEENNFLKFVGEERVSSEAQVDDILVELKKRGIVENIIGSNYPLVNYPLLAKELIKENKTHDEVVFVVDSMKEAFENLFSKTEKKNNLTQILSEMGVLEENDCIDWTGHICAK